MKSDTFHLETWLYNKQESFQIIEVWVCWSWRPNDSQNVTALIGRLHDFILVLHMEMSFFTQFSVVHNICLHMKGRCF